MKEVLSYQSVEICFKGQRVVHDVNFTLHPGEILGIVGESGSGKSTILKAAMGLLGNSGRVTKGNLCFQGKSLLDLSEKEFRKIRGEQIGMIFQDAGASLCPIRKIGSQIYESITAGKSLLDLSEKEFRKIRGEQIGMIFQDAGASLCPIRKIGSQIYESITAHKKMTREEAKEKALNLLEKLNFQDVERIWNSYPFELSGGMNQRVGIAIAMLMEPSVLLADEPTSALDVAVQRQVVQEMLSLREMFGTAMLLVTHDIGVASAMADTMLVLKDGAVMEYGDTRQVLEAPENEYTRKLLAAVPRLRRI